MKSNQRPADYAALFRHPATSKVIRQPSQDRWPAVGLRDAYNIYIIAACGSGTTRRKRQPTSKNTGVSLSDAEGVLEDPPAITVEDPGAEGEQRFITIGLGSAGELLVVVWTERDDECRVISVRRPTRKERKQYES